MVTNVMPPFYGSQCSFSVRLLYVSSQKL